MKRKIGLQTLPNLFKSEEKIEQHTRKHTMKNTNYHLCIAIDRCPKGQLTTREKKTNISSYTWLQQPQPGVIMHRGMQVLLAPKHVHAALTCTGTHACRYYLHRNKCMQVHITWEPSLLYYNARSDVVHCCTPMVTTPTSLRSGARSRLNFGTHFVHNTSIISDGICVHRKCLNGAPQY